MSASDAPATADVPEMPAPRVREFPAHSIGGEAAGVELDEERKAAMVSDLMVVVCGDRAPQPVLSTGTAYR